MKKIEWMKYKLLKIISLKIKLNVLNTIQIQMHLYKSILIIKLTYNFQKILKSYILLPENHVKNQNIYLKKIIIELNQKKIELEI